MDATVTEEVFVQDILAFVISQPDGPASSTTVISETVADPLTRKSCKSSGICHVKTQLPSKFFLEADPKDLLIDGVALLAFGSARRLVQVPIQQTLRQLLKVIDDNTARLLKASSSAEFNLKVGLAPKDGLADRMVIGGCALLAVLVLFTICCCCRRRRRDLQGEEKYDETLNSDYVTSSRSNFRNTDDGDHNRWSSKSAFTASCDVDTFDDEPKPSKSPSRTQCEVFDV